MQPTVSPKTIRGWWIAPTIAVLVPVLLVSSGLMFGASLHEVLVDLMKWPRFSWRLAREFPVFLSVVATTSVLVLVVSLVRRSLFLIQLLVIALSAGWIGFHLYLMWRALAAAGGP